MAKFPATEDKDPGAVLDYYLDLAALTNGTGTSNYLQAGETIATVSSVTTSGASLVVDSYSIISGGTVVKVWLSGGVVGTKYTVTVKFTTSVAGRQDERSFTVKILEQ